MVTDIVFRRFLLSIFVIAASTFIICSAVTEKAAAEFYKPSRVLNISAASDLHTAFGEIGPGFEKKYGIKVVINFGSTGLLARQIENGAPVDVFAAASMKYIDSLAEKNLVIDHSVQRFARGRLALVFRVPDVNTYGPEALVNNNIKRIAIANPGHAPYGEAAIRFLKNAGLWAGVQDKIVYGNNVRDALSYVKTGNADAGMVALSLVINDPDVSYRLLDDELYTPIEQGVAIIKDTKSAKEAELFINYLNSREARQILQKYGFVTD